MQIVLWRFSWMKIVLKYEISQKRGGNIQNSLVSKEINLHFNNRNITKWSQVKD